MRSKEDRLLPQKMAVISGLLPYLPLETCRPLGGGFYMCGEKPQELIGSSLAEHNEALTENFKGNCGIINFCTILHLILSQREINQITFPFSMIFSANR